MHVGGVRTALFNYLFAKKQGGQFILRLEDTDRERFVADGVEQIVKSLGWLGLVPDKGFWISEGKHTGIEYVQSERHKNQTYRQFAEQLVGDGLAYYSSATAAELEKLRQQAAQNRTAFLYRKQYESEHRASPAGETRPIRLDIEAIKRKRNSAVLEWRDEIRDCFSENLDLVEDFILIKSDSFPTYNFANVIDDHDMTISHVIRGDEFISSTGKHALLYELFGWQPPKFVHLPVINGTDGKKLSKRSGDTDVLDYQRNGYLPEALLNFLVLLGWNDGTEQEIFSFAELIDKFSLERVNTSPAVFDPKRLDWVSGHHMRALPLDELFGKARGFWPLEAEQANDDCKKRILGLVQERLKYFAELPELTRFFFVDLPVDAKLISQHKQLKKLSNAELKALLEQAKNSLQESDFSTDDLTERLNQLLEQTGQKPVVLFSLIRVATTQAPASPGLADTLAVLGKQRSLQRLDSQLDALA
jgi:glutamyl-tRNA synthetase